MPYLSVSEAARRLKARPKDISDLFYRAGACGMTYARLWRAGG